MDAFLPKEPQCCAVIFDIKSVFRWQSFQPRDHPCAYEKGLSCAGKGTAQSCIVNSK